MRYGNRGTSFLQTTARLIIERSCQQSTAKAPLDIDFHLYPEDTLSGAIRFRLYHRDVKEVMTERGSSTSYQTIRQWCRNVFERNSWYGNPAAKLD
jgi:hypothetical protein